MNTMQTEKYEVYRKRGRTAFTQDQLLVMQEEFIASQYLSSERRKHLARELNLEEEKIKVWFQNRRQKSRNRLGQRRVRGTRRINQEDADSTVTSPDGQKSRTILQGGNQDQGPSPRQNPYENYGFSEAEVNYHLNRSQRRNLKTGSDTNGYKELPFSHHMSGRQQRVPFVSLHQNGNQHVGSNVSKMRFNTHPYKRMNPLPAQHSGPHLSTMQSYPAASTSVNPLQNSEASAAYNRNGYGRSQLVQDNWQARMIPQQFNGYRMVPNAQFSQSPSIYKREFIPRAHGSQEVKFANVQQSQQNLHQSFNRQIMTKQGQWTNSPSFNRRQPMTQYHSSQYVHQNNNNVYYQDRNPVLPVDLSNGNVLEHQSFNCKVEGSSLSQRRNIIQNSSLPSCSFSNNVPITRKLPSSGHSAFTHYDNSCQFETLPFRLPSLSSSAFGSNFETSSSFQNGICEAPVQFQNNISSDEPSHLANYSPRPSSSFNLVSNFPMSSSTRHGIKGVCEPSMNSQNTQVYQNFPSMSTINPNTSGSSLADLCDHIPLIKDEILDNSTIVSTTDAYSSMSSVENLCDELMAVQDSKASESFNDTYFLGGPNDVQRKRVNSRNFLPGSNMPYFKNPNDSFEIAHILREENDLFDRNNVYGNSNGQNPTLSKSGFNNPAPAYSQVDVSYNHVDGLTIPLNNFPFYSDTYTNSTQQAVQPVVNTSGINSVTASHFNNDSQISSTCNPETFLENQSCDDDMAQLIRDVIDTERYTA